MDHTVMCPKCGCMESVVVDSRPMGTGRWRRHKCSNCGAKYNTYENIVGRKKAAIRTNLFDLREVHENCTVEILTNSMTGEVSVGWWKGKKNA